MNKLVILVRVSGLTCCISCKKTDVPNTTPLSPKDSDTIMGFKDSAQLIINICYISYDSATNTITDSILTYFYYDTLTRKMSLKLKYYFDPAQALLDSFEYSYKSTGLLIQVANKSSQANSGSRNVLKEGITYGANNVVKAVTDNFSEGTTPSCNMNKTSVAIGGYSLNCFDLFNAADTAYCTVNFDNTGRTTSYYFDAYFDSIIYDATGNISKLMRTEYLHLPNAPDNYMMHDFVSKDNKGDQLYNPERILNNGISNFSSENSFGVVAELDYQYFKYPALSSNAYRFTDGYDSGGVEYTLNFVYVPK